MLKHLTLVQITQQDFQYDLNDRIPPHNSLKTNDEARQIISEVKLVGEENPQISEVFHNLTQRPAPFSMQN